MFKTPLVSCRKPKISQLAGLDRLVLAILILTLGILLYQTKSEIDAVSRLDSMPRERPTQTSLKQVMMKLEYRMQRSHWVRSTKMLVMLSKPQESCLSQSITSALCICKTGETNRTSSGFSRRPVCHMRLLMWNIVTTKCLALSYSRCVETSSKKWTITCKTAACTKKEPSIQGATLMIWSWNSIWLPSKQGSSNSTYSQITRLSMRLVCRSSFLQGYPSVYLRVRVYLNLYHTRQRITMRQTSRQSSAHVSAKMTRIWRQCRRSRIMVPEVDSRI